MRTQITFLALFAGAAVFAQDNGTTTQQQEPVPHVESIYDECLMVAGPNSWQALHLSEDQMVRVADLQARYKQSAQAAKEKALADEAAAAKAAKKGKVKKEAAPATAAVQPAEAASTAVEQKPEGTTLEPVVAMDGSSEKDLEDPTADMVPLPDLSYSPIDSELRSILTPEQLLIWERRCDSRTSMHP